MTPPSKPEHAPDDQAVEPADPDAAVNAWRVDQLARAGYTDPILSLLAVDHDIDLHRACWLLASGCDESTAYLILT